MRTAIAQMRASVRWTHNELGFGVWCASGSFSEGGSFRIEALLFRLAVCFILEPLPATTTRTPEPSIFARQDGPGTR